jgi:hypothetical protein
VPILDQLAPEVKGKNRALAKVNAGVI